jgi:hypothetical protein
LNVPRLLTSLAVALIGAIIVAPAVSATPLPRVSMDLSVDAGDCSAIVLTAKVDWQKVRLTASPDYLVEWFAVGSFSQTLGTSEFDPGRWAGKPHGTASATITRDGNFDAAIYEGSSYSASLRLVATGQVIATSDRVPIAACVQPAAGVIPA